MNQELHDYFNGDAAASHVWENKYQLKDSEGRALEITPDDMHNRLATEFFKADQHYEPIEIVSMQKNRDKLSEYGRIRPASTHESIYNLFKDFKYVIPQGSVMAQAGSPTLGSLSNCVVMDSPNDSYGGIMYTDQQLAQLFKRRCGVGIDISTLRPANAATSNAAKTSTGAVSFMHRFSNTTREVAQNGRRGALMLSMDINHPDVEDFIKAKEDLTKVTGANISVRLNDEFMEAALEDKDYYLTFPCDLSPNEWLWHDTVTEYDRTYVKSILNETVYVKKIRAKELWDTLIKMAHGVAEPGILNWDSMTRYSPDSVYPQYLQKSTNPCSEIGMQAGDSCRLIALNLLSYVENPYTNSAWFNFDKFQEHVYEAMRLSDNLVTMEMHAVMRIIDKIISDPEPDEVKQVELDTWQKLLETGMETRRVGLGVTALADTLAALGYKYDSREALMVTESIFKGKMSAELDATTDLAILRGKFKEWDVDKEFFIEGGTVIEGHNPFYDFLLTEFPEETHRMIAYGRRNLSWSTCAPTGSLSMLAQTSSGIEPVFMLSYMRRIKVNPNDKNARVDFVDENGDSFREEPVLHHQFRAWIETQMPGIDVYELSADEVKEWADKSPWVGATAPEIDWGRRVEVQAAIQKYTTHSISSTINLPKDVEVSVVEDIYIEAWRQGLKGVTVYRDGARSGILVSESKPKEEGFKETNSVKRPKRVKGKTLRFNNNKEKWIAFVGLIDNKPYEIFTGKLENVELPTKIEFGEIVKVKDDEGTTRYDFEYEGGVVEGISKMSSRDFWNYGKLISGVLRHGMPLPYVVDTITGLDFEEDHINTWRNGVVRALRKFIKSGAAKDRLCPDCGDPDGMRYEEGCLKCKSCGNTKCG